MTKVTIVTAADGSNNNKVKKALQMADVSWELVSLRNSPPEVLKPYIMAMFAFSDGLEDLINRNRLDLLKAYEDAPLSQLIDYLCSKEGTWALKIPIALNFEEERVSVGMGDIKETYRVPKKVRKLEQSVRLADLNTYATVDLRREEK